MTSNLSFKQLCILDNHGYSFDESTAYIPKDPENFEEVILKLSAKIETSLYLIECHKGQLKEFTLVSIPFPQTIGIGFSKPKQFLQQDKRSQCVEGTWQMMNNVGWDNLQVLAVLNEESIPVNGSRNQTLSTFVTCLLESLKAYFLFVNPKPTYAWSEISHKCQDAEGGFAFALVWKNSSLKPIFVPQMKRGRRNNAIPAKKKLRVLEYLYKHNDFKRKLEEDSDTESEEELEITFKDHKSFVRTPSLVKRASPVEPPNPILEATSSSSNIRRARGRPTRSEKFKMPQEEEPMETESFANSTIADMTLGFELNAGTPSRKSGMRKSIAPDWPEEEKCLILNLFDNLNPELSEQKRIVLTCRYVLIQYEKELTSKLLYIWIQKKGRQPQRTIESFELNEEEQKAEIMDFFGSLNPSQPENTRIAFTLKYFQAQYNVNLPSKQLYAWLNNKPVKKARKSMK